MAGLCSKYLEKKILEFQNSDLRWGAGYRSDDEKYGFLPTPFKRNRKRDLQQRTSKHVQSNERSHVRDSASKAAKNSKGLRDITNCSSTSQLLKHQQHPCVNEEHFYSDKSETNSSKVRRRPSYKRCLAHEFDISSAFSKTSVVATTSVPRHRTNDDYLDMQSKVFRKDYRKDNATNMQQRSQSEATPKHRDIYPIKEHEDIKWNPSQQLQPTRMGTNHCESKTRLSCRSRSVEPGIQSRAKLLNTSSVQSTASSTTDKLRASSKDNNQDTKIRNNSRRSNDSGIFMDTQQGTKHDSFKSPQQNQSQKYSRNQDTAITEQNIDDQYRLSIKSQKQRTYPRTIQDVEHALYSASITNPANVVMFVVKPQRLRDNNNSALPYKAYAGMLINALYAVTSLEDPNTHAQVYVRLPNGLAGFLSRDSLQPLGVKVSRDFSSQFPTGTSLNDPPQDEDSGILSPKVCYETANNRKCLTSNDRTNGQNGTARHAMQYTETALDSSFFSDTSFMSSLNYSDTFSIPQPMADTNGVAQLRSKTQGAFQKQGQSHRRYSTERNALLDYLKVTEQNSLKQFVSNSTRCASERKPNHTPPKSTEININSSTDKFRKSNGAYLPTGQTPVNTSQHYDPDVSLTMDNTHLSTHFSARDSESSGYSSTSNTSSSTPLNPGDISTIKLSEITYRPPLNGNLDISIYENLPDISKLLQNCHIQDANTSLSHQTEVETRENIKSCGQTVSSTNKKLKNSAHVHPIRPQGTSRDHIKSSLSSMNTSILARTGSFDQTLSPKRHCQNLCSSRDCAMCSPTNKTLDISKSCKSPENSEVNTESSSTKTASSSALTPQTSSMTSSHRLTTCSTGALRTKTNFQALKQNRSFSVNESITKKLNNSPQRNHSLNRTIDLLKTIKTIETADSGNWSENTSESESTPTASDDEKINENPRLTAVFDYDATSSYDVTIRKQDVVTLLNDKHKDWFWIQKETGEVGYIPRSYVVNLEKLNLDPHTKTTYL